MTAIADGIGAMKLISTGEFSSPGAISVEAFGAFDPRVLAGKRGVYGFSFPGGSVSGYAICQSVSVDAKVGDILRISMTLQMTDYPG